MSEAMDPVIRRGEAPLVLSLPHVGTAIPEDIEPRLVSPWLARKDADWWIDQLYDFAAQLDATIIRAQQDRIERLEAAVESVLDVVSDDYCPTTKKCPEYGKLVRNCRDHWRKWLMDGK